jgi:hypothetical protein
MNNDTSWLNDCYRIGGKDFPMSDSAKGIDEGPEDTVNQSETQKAPRLNASRGKYGPTIKGAEGAAFPTSDNGVESESENQTFAGDKDSSVSVNLVSGQIESSKGDVKTNRI